jgi:hypothetical protein
MRGATLSLTPRRSATGRRFCWRWGRRSALTLQCAGSTARLGIDDFFLDYRPHGARATDEFIRAVRSAATRPDALPPRLQDQQALRGRHLLRLRRVCPATWRGDRIVAPAWPSGAWPRSRSPQPGLRRGARRASICAIGHGWISTRRQRRWCEDFQPISDARASALTYRARSCAANLLTRLQQEFVKAQGNAGSHTAIGRPMHAEHPSAMGQRPGDERARRSPPVQAPHRP